MEGGLRLEESEHIHDVEQGLFQESTEDECRGWEGQAQDDDADGDGNEETEDEDIHLGHGPRQGGQSDIDQEHDADDGGVLRQASGRGVLGLVPLEVLFRRLVDLRAERVPDALVREEDGLRDEALLVEGRHVRLLDDGRHVGRR